MNLFGAPFHSTYERSSVDAFSNFVELPEFNFEPDIEGLLRGRMNIERLPLFLHEATHHWCFDTPVFYALYLIKFRALASLTKLTNHEQVEELDIVDDIYRYRAMVDLYRPIIEGLALFAEHITLPRGNFTYSHPFTQMLGMCKGWLEEMSSQGSIQQNVTKLLFAARSNDAHIRKKGGLLAMPFDPGRSPYLTGYTLICGIWQAMMHGGLAFIANTDAFLSYMRSYLFFDYELIAILLNDSLHENAIVEHIARHLIRRLLRLFNHDLTKLLALQALERGGYTESEARQEEMSLKEIWKLYSPESLEKALAEWDTNDLANSKTIRVVRRANSSLFHRRGISGLERVFKPIKGILNDATIERQAQKKLIAAYEWMIPCHGDSKEANTLREFVFGNLLERTNLVLCGCEVRATVKDNRCTLHWNGRIMVMAAAPGALPGKYSARLDLVISSRVQQPLMYVYADDRLVGLAVPDALLKAISMEIRPLETRGGSAFQKFVTILRTTTEESPLIADSLVAILTEGYETAIRETVDHVYDTVFMAMAPHADWAAEREKMRVRGLLGFEDVSFAAIRGLARFSQVSGVPMSTKAWNEMVAHIRGDGDVPDLVDEAVRCFGQGSKFPLIFSDDELHFVAI